MEQQAFDLLSSTERSWWYRGRARVVFSLLAKFARRGGDVLDYGAGPGGMQSTLARIGAVYGFEPDTSARDNARRRGYVEVYADEAEALHRTYGVVAFLDVLEHVEDDVVVLQKIGKSLSEGGVVIITVPAFQFLWSVHDETHHHFRRYSRSHLVRVLHDAGYEVSMVSYWNCILFVPALVMRLLGKVGDSALHLPPFLNNMLFGLISVEAMLMRVVPLPFGLSLVAVARKR